LYVYDPLLEQSPEHLEHVTYEFWELIQQQHAVVAEGRLSWDQYLAAADKADIGIVWCARKGRVVTRTVRLSVPLATQGSWVVSMTSAHRMAGRIMGP
jgi:hypothetical protein